MKLAIVGVGKMGISHLSIARAHPEVEIVGVCDSSRYLVDVLAKYTGVPAFTDYAAMLDQANPDAVVIATPTHLHASMVRAALERDVHVFCEKPLFLDLGDGQRLTELAQERGLVTQVGYHNRFVASFAEARRLVATGAIGSISSTLAEAYGPVVLKPSGGTWRGKRETGGGALYDYAAHPLDLLTWFLGEPEAVSGSRLTSIFSATTDDAVATSLHYRHGSAQLSVNWSDESQRKMTTKVTLWGTAGRIYVDRQELHVYLREGAAAPEGYRSGWNVRYTTDLTDATPFYLRGEEYSAQMDEFVRRVIAGEVQGLNDFASASATDRVIAEIGRDARTPRDRETGRPVQIQVPRQRASSSQAPASPRASSRASSRVVQKAREIRQAVRAGRKERV